MLSEPLTLYKLMILYMLKHVKFPLSNGQIAEFFVDKEYCSYFTFQTAVNELLDAHLIKQEIIRNISRYEITREGEETLVFFGSSINSEIQNDINQFLKDNKLRLRNEVAIVADYFKSSNSDYVVRCEIREGKSVLIQMNISVPSEEDAEVVCDNWSECNQEVYSTIMANLLKSRH